LNPWFFTAREFPPQGPGPTRRFRGTCSRPDPDPLGRERQFSRPGLARSSFAPARKRPARVGSKQGGPKTGSGTRSRKRVSKTVLIIDFLGGIGHHPRRNGRGGKPPIDRSAVLQAVDCFDRFLENQILTRGRPLRTADRAPGASRRLRGSKLNIPVGMYMGPVTIDFGERVIGRTGHNC